VFEAIRDAAMTLVRWILWTAPIGVFALALALVARLGVSAIGALAGYIGLVALMTIAFGLVLYPLASLLGGVSILEFARAVLPAQAVALSSRSSLAALPAMIEGARARLRCLTDQLFPPLAASVYRIGAAIEQTVSDLHRQLRRDAWRRQLATVVLTAVATGFSVPASPADPSSS
jgi:Na+/H+-dicarboxylate symporter